MCASRAHGLASLDADRSEHDKDAVVGANLRKAHGASLPRGQLLVLVDVTHRSAGPAWTFMSVERGIFVS